MKNLNHYLVLLGLLFVVHAAQSQKYWSRVSMRPSTLGLERGYDTLRTPEFQLVLVRASQTVAALSSQADPEFDFTPGDRLHIRDKDSLYHLGDLNFVIRAGKDSTWSAYSTAWHRRPVRSLSVEGNVLAAADLSNSLPAEVPLQVQRYYVKEGGDLVMRFTLTNTSGKKVEIGALGVPMIFNNILEGNSLEEAHARNVFFDPYIGMDAGYLEVKPLDGKGQVLLVLPEKNMPFEAYRPLLDDPTPRSIVFEGFHEWMSHSKAYAEEKWKGVSQWNTPSSVILEPGDTRMYSLRFVLAESIREIEETLVARDRPVAVGVPGYVLPQDVEGKLFLKYPRAVKEIHISPKDALRITEKDSLASGYKAYAIRGKKWGRAKLRIVYQDGLEQTINYKVIKPEQEVVQDFGNFLLTEQWFTGEDLFNRTPSVITYDYGTGQKVTQDRRAWIAGLSDEGGAGSWLGAIMKQLVAPDTEEVEKLEAFVHETLWGGIQYDQGKNKYGVRKSMFYYEPREMPAGTYSDTINYDSWAAWNKRGADDPGRSYNYPHVTAAYWTMYRLSRYHQDLVDREDWKWYLTQAFHTAKAMTELAPHYAQFGQMEGTVFLLLLKDLQREGFSELATELEAMMKDRADHWKSLAYPFGSEMPWDSTGQEEVFMWSDYFGYEEKAAVTLNAILAYMPTLPHWAYNGNARRYWDFLYGGKLSRIERQIHHYGSGLNAIPVLEQFRQNPDDLYLLRVGYGGLMGAISNITRDGFGPAAFHSFPSTLEIDQLSGDYGSGFFGYAVNTSTYIVHDDRFGWLSFGANLSEQENSLTARLTTAGKNRIFLQPEQLWVRLRAGKVQAVSYDTKSGSVSLRLAPADEVTPHAYLDLPEGWEVAYPREQGLYKIPLKNSPLELDLIKS